MTIFLLSRLCSPQNPARSPRNLAALLYNATRRYTSVYVRKIILINEREEGERGNAKPFAENFRIACSASVIRREEAYCTRDETYVLSSPTNQKNRSLSREEIRRCGKNALDMEANYNNR